MLGGEQADVVPAEAGGSQVLDRGLELAHVVEYRDRLAHYRLMLVGHRTSRSLNGAELTRWANTAPWQHQHSAMAT
jgi:hypothetical protein